jgi:hypothetical protein
LWPQIALWPWWQDKLTLHNSTSLTVIKVQVLFFHLAFVNASYQSEMAITKCQSGLKDQYYTNIMLFFEDLVVLQPLIMNNKSSVFQPLDRFLEVWGLDFDVLCISMKFDLFWTPLGHLCMKHWNLFQRIRKWVYINLEISHTYCIALLHFHCWLFNSDFSI